MGPKSDSQTSHTKTIKQQVYDLLDANPLLTAKPLCKLLELNYEKYGDYVAHKRTQWKYDPKKQQGSKCSSVHGWRGWSYVPKLLSRAAALQLGWKETKARNRWFLWKERLGRIEWFETDRINFYVRAPANKAKAYQLICNAFSFTGLITDMKVLQHVLEQVKFKSAHFVFETGQKLPKFTIDLFGKSNGIIIKVGDRSNPTCVEVIASYMDWAERNERLNERLVDVLERMLQDRADLKGLGQQDKKSAWYVQ